MFIISLLVTLTTGAVGFVVDLDNTIKIITVQDANSLCITIIHHVANVVFGGAITVTGTSYPCVLIARVSVEHVTGFADAVSHQVVCALHSAVTIRRIVAGKVVIQLETSSFHRSPVMRGSAFTHACTISTAHRMIDRTAVTIS